MGRCSVIVDVAIAGAHLDFNLMMNGIQLQLLGWNP